MLKRFKKLLSSSSKTGLKRIPSTQHGIQKHQISNSALKVIEELQDNGWEAYLVGGGVRDLLLGGQPKDFDVATNATPEQVQHVFRKARIIGRRFKIVHVRMGREVLEVTTFRGSHNQSRGQQHAEQNDKGILLRDNVYGDLESDAYRRDFSINALYYDPCSEEIIDYTEGMEDLSQRRLRIIGEPEARYKEDPVRMLRAIRFMCKLGFTLDDATERPIREHSDYLCEIPSARLFEEVLKLFLSGSAKSILLELNRYHLLEHLIPGAERALVHGTEQQTKLLYCAAANTDARIAQRKRVTPAFIYAALLWPALTEKQEALREHSPNNEQERLFRAAELVVSEQLQKTAIPRRFLTPMRDIWSLQLRLIRRDPKRAQSLVEHPRFRAAYDFLLLREQSGENLQNLGQWWTQFQFSNDDEQNDMLEKIQDKPGRRRRKRKPQKDSHRHD